MRLYATVYGGEHDMGIVDEDTGRDVALVRGADEESRAFASLAAAAPELLEALRVAELTIRYAAQESAGRVKAEIVGGWLHHAQQAASAIAKAEGRG